MSRKPRLWKGLLAAVLVVTISQFASLCEAQDTVSLSQVENDIAWLINYERSAAGLAQLGQDTKLSAVARTHSEEMRDRKYVGHESPVAGRRLPDDRYRLGCPV